MKPVYLEEPTPITEGLPETSWEQIADASEPEWLIEGIIPKGKQVHLFGPSGVGKSLLALQFALNVIEGTQTFGTLPTVQGSVMYLDYENGEGTLKARLSSYGYMPQDFDWFQNKLHMYCYPQMPSLDTQDAEDMLWHNLTTNKPQLVIVDSIGLAFDGEENSADSYKGFGRHLARLLRELEIAALLLDNTGKDPKKGSRGSSRKKDEADVQWLLEATTMTSYQLTSKKERIQGIPKAIAIDKHEDPTLHWTQTRPKEISQGATDLIKRMKKDPGIAPGTPTSVTALKGMGYTGKQVYLQEAVTWWKAHYPNGYQPGIE